VRRLVKTGDGTLENEEAEGDQDVACEKGGGGRRGKPLSMVKERCDYAAGGCRRVGGGVLLGERCASVVVGSSGGR